MTEPVDDLCGCADDGVGLSRRALLGGATVLGVSAAAGPWGAGGASAAPAGDVIVTVFLRGGMDALSAVTPWAEAAYHRARPGLRVGRPLRLDGHFGFHPSMEKLHSIYRRGRLAVVHAVGSPEATRSHFDAQDIIERATPGSHRTTSGWLGRHLETRSGGRFRAVAMGTTVQPALFGSVSAIALRQAEEFKLRAATDAQRGRLEWTLNRLYESLGVPVANEAEATLHAVNTLRSVAARPYRPANRAKYPDTDLGRQFSELARLIRSRIGVEVGCIDAHGWDMHSGLGNQMRDRLYDLDRSLGAFYTDLSGLWGVTVVVMSEFGRRVAENGSGGTDHGTGGAMLVLGGGVRGGRVYGRWPGLSKNQLVDGDLRPTTDYRTVLAEVLDKRARNPHVGAVFPRFDYRPLGLAWRR